MEKGKFIKIKRKIQKIALNTIDFSFSRTPHLVVWPDNMDTNSYFAFALVGTLCEICGCKGCA